MCILATDLSDVRSTLRWQIVHKNNLNLGVLQSNLICSEHMKINAELELARDHSLAYA